MGGSGRGEDGFFAQMRELKAFRDQVLGGQPSDRALARMLGVSATTVGEWLRAVRFPQDPGKVARLVQEIAVEADRQRVPVPGAAADAAAVSTAHREETSRRANVVSRAVQEAQGGRILGRHASSSHCEGGVRGAQLGDRNVQMNVFAGPATAKLRPDAYLEQVRRIAPPELAGREAELEELGLFCAGSSGLPYAWWRAGPWAGKSALLSWFVLHPPAAVAGRVRIVSFFVTARLAAQDTRETFTRVLQEQLADLLGEALPDVVPEATRDAYLLDLMSRAAAACEEAGRRLVLVVDGLDEDRGLTGPDAHSIAGLLPGNLPAGMRVIVAGRPDPPIPADVPDWHPLRDPAIIRQLAPSPYARDIQRLSRQELNRLLKGSALERDVLGLLTAARGGLTARDLARLADADLWDIEKILGTVILLQLARQGSEGNEASLRGPCWSRRR